MSGTGREPRGTTALVAVAPRTIPTGLARRERRPLREHIPAWLFWTEHARGLAANTVMGYGLDAKMFVAFCDQVGIAYADQVTFQVIEAFGAALRGRLGQQATSVARRYSALKQLFRFLIREGVVTANPVEQAIRMKLPPRKPPTFVTRRERDHVLRTLAAGRDLTSRRNHAIVLCLFYSGLRESEIVNLAIEDVRIAEAAHSYLHVRSGKGDKDRLVPIPPRLREGLRTYLHEVRPALQPPAGNRWLFVRLKRGRARDARERMHPKALWKIAKEVISPLVGRRVGVHTMRHSYATHIYEASSDLNLVKSLLGHSSISTTAVYAHVTPSKQRERLAEYLR